MGNISLQRHRQHTFRTYVLESIIGFQRACHLPADTLSHLRYALESVNHVEYVSAPDVTTVNADRNISVIRYIVL